MGPPMNYENLRDEYRRLWDSMQLTKRMESAGKATAKKIADKKDRYKVIEQETGVPWYVVGCIHAMESGCRWNCHLHNGDPLTARTKLVPRGRPLTGKPPFTWEESAIDAITQKGWQQIESWSIERILYEMERYNGWGYRKYHKSTLSPYLWSGTGHYSRGKYVADGKWSSTAVSGQSGAAMLLKRVAELDDTIQLFYDGEAPDHIEPDIVPETFPKAEPTPVADAVKESWTLRGAGIGLLGTIAAFFDGAMKSLMDAAGHIAAWTPATGVLATLGANAKQIGFGLAVAGLVIVVSRRVSAARNGKIG